MIRIKATGGIGGDETYPYKALMDRPYTVREFVEEVASDKRNWGTSRYTASAADGFGESLCDYRYGEIGELDDSIAGRQVKEAWGSGGWSCYGFTLLV